MRRVRRSARELRHGLLSAGRERERAGAGFASFLYFNHLAGRGGGGGDGGGECGAGPAVSRDRPQRAPPALATSCRCSSSSGAV
ncbi:unnamed protein product, partial [Brenthis ino]